MAESPFKKSPSLNERITERLRIEKAAIQNKGLLDDNVFQMVNSSFQLGGTKLTINNIVQKLGSKEQPGAMPQFLSSTVYSSLHQDFRRDHQISSAQSLLPEILLPLQYPQIPRDIQDLKTKLQKVYQKTCLPTVKWMQKGKPLHFKTYYVKLHLTLESKEDIGLDELMTGKRRVLLEAQPGYGKTTIATKIVFDWAEEEEYVKRFMLAFFLPLRVLHVLHSEDIVEAIAKFYKFENEVLLREFYQENCGSILFVLDGYDEINPKQREILHDLLHGILYEQATVVLTCRSGLFSKDKLDDSLYYGFMAPDFEDRRVIVMGLGDKDQRVFLSKFVSGEEVDKVLDFVYSLNVSLQYLFRSPLFLLLLALIVIEAQHISEIKIETMTDLFELLVNYTVKRSVAKSKSDVGKAFSIFNSGDLKCYEHFLTIAQFGYECCQCYLKGNYTFEESDDSLASKTYNLGLLNYTKLEFVLREEVFYEFFHRTIMEFVIACYFYVNIHSKNSEVSYLITQILVKFPTSLVAPFIIGLLKENLLKFFDLIPGTEHVFASNEDFLWKVLQENKFKDFPQLRSIQNFLPVNITLKEDFANFFSSPFFKALIAVGVKAGKFKSIRINHNPLLLELPLDMNYSTIQVNNFLDVDFSKFDSGFKRRVLRDSDMITHNEESVFAVSEHLKCENLVIDESVAAMDNSNFLKFFTAEQVSFNSMRLLFYHRLSKRWMPPIASFCARLFPSIDTGAFVFFKQILSNNELGCLAIESPKESSKDDKMNEEIWQAVLANLNSVSRLSFICHGKTLKCNLQQLVAIKSNWFSILLYNVGLEPNTIGDGVVSVHHLSVNTCNDLTVKALSQVDLCSFECTAQLLNCLPEEWSGYNSITELSVQLDNFACDIKFWEKLLCFKNLEVLTVYPVQKDFDLQGKATEISSILLKLPIKHLYLSSFISDFSWVKDLIESIRYRLQSRDVKCNLKEFSVETWSDVTMNDTILILLDCLKKHYLFKVNVVTNSRNWLMLLNEVVDVTVFNVESCEMACDRPTDANVNQIRYNYREDLYNVLWPGIIVISTNYKHKIVLKKAPQKECMLM